MDRPLRRFTAEGDPTEGDGDGRHEREVREGRLETDTPREGEQRVVVCERDRRDDGQRPDRDPPDQPTTWQRTGAHRAGPLPEWRTHVCLSVARARYEAAP